MRAGTPASTAPGSRSRGTMASTTASRISRAEGSRGPAPADCAKAELGLRQRSEVHTTPLRKARRPAFSESIAPILAAPRIIRQAYRAAPRNFPLDGIAELGLSGEPTKSNIHKNNLVAPTGHEPFCTLEFRGVVRAA